MANLKLKDLIKKNNFFVIAESGSNHEGSIDDALKLIREASKAGANAVKFQSFTSKTLFAQKEYTKILKMPENALDNVDDIVLKKEWYETLYKEANKNKIILMSTPFSVEAVDDMDKYVPIYKIASCDIDNIPLLRKIASTKKPVILSTGLATNKDIKNALNILKNNEVALLHCSVEYPTPLENARLNRIVVMNKLFKKNIIGYSDHTIGIDAPIIAYTLGAKIIEKHFTLDHNMEGPDHKASLEPDELKQMVDGIRKTEKALGNGIKTASPSEKKNIQIARKSIVARRNIEKGEILTEENLAVKRPGNGISPMRWYEVIGTKAIRDFSEDEMIEC